MKSTTMTLGLVLTCVAANTALAQGRGPEPEPPAAPEPAAPVQLAFDMGPVVIVHETTTAGNYEGIWTQRGDSNVYDAEWVFVPTGGKSVDVLTVGELIEGFLSIRSEYRQGNYMTVVSDSLIFGGSAEWAVTDANYDWKVVAQHEYAQYMLEDRPIVQCMGMISAAWDIIADAGPDETDDQLIERMLQEDPQVGALLRVLQQAFGELDNQNYDNSYRVPIGGEAVMEGWRYAETADWLTRVNAATTEAEAGAVLDDILMKLEPCLMRAGLL